MRARREGKNLINQFRERGGNESELARYLLINLGDLGITTEEIQSEFRRTNETTMTDLERRGKLRYKRGRERDGD